MKHQYFGDKTDYIKHGILRKLRLHGVRLGVHWMLTEDDSSSDGSRVSYLSDMALRHYDPQLFDAIRHSLAAGRRSLQVLDEHGLLSGVLQCYDDWQTDEEQRLASVRDLAKRVGRGGVLFFDPDNGLEIPSVPRKHRASTKYVFLEELAAAWQEEVSLIVYQHFPRVNREQYMDERLRWLRARLTWGRAVAIKTSHVAFLCLIHVTSWSATLQVIRAAVSHWYPHASLYLLADDNKMKLINANG